MEDDLVATLESLVADVKRLDDQFARLEPVPLTDERRQQLRESLREQTDTQLVVWLLSLTEVAQRQAMGRGFAAVQAVEIAVTETLGRLASEALAEAVATRDGRA